MGRCIGTTEKKEKKNSVSVAPLPLYPLLTLADPPTVLYILNYYCTRSQHTHTYLVLVLVLLTELPEVCKAGVHRGSCLK